MTHGSLFSGIGGFDLAARWMGWDNLFHVEFNPWCKQVLEYHFPESQSYSDVKTFDGTIWRGKVDVLSGGFPCQPYSSAGKRLGKEDERHLWPEMRRIISEVAPAYVVGENVRGLTNWNGGVVFEEVCADLEAEGYDVWTGILPACGVGAPHRRDRIWFVAHAPGRGNLGTSGRLQSKEGAQRVQERHGVSKPHQSGGVRDAADTDCRRLERTIEIGRYGVNVERQSQFGNAADTDGGGGGTLCQDVQPQEPNGKGLVCDGREWDATDTERVRLEHVTERSGVGKGEGKTRRNVAEDIEANGDSQDVANSHVQRSQRGEENGNLARGGAESDQFTGGHVRTEWENFPTQPPVCGGDDGLPRQLDGVAFPKWRNESIKAYGNAIVPQVAHAIFRAIFDTASRF